MDTSQKIDWLKEQLCRADSAERALLSAKKQRVSEYDERLRKLRDFEDKLYIARTDLQQQELFTPDALLDPAMERLLSMPLRGLD